MSSEQGNVIINKGVIIKGALISKKWTIAFIIMFLILMIVGLYSSIAIPSTPAVKAVCALLVVVATILSIIALVIVFKGAFENKNHDTKLLLLSLFLIQLGIVISNGVNIAVSITSVIMTGALLYVSIKKDGSFIIF